MEESPIIKYIDEYKKPFIAFRKNPTNLEKNSSHCIIESCNKIVSFDIKDNTDFLSKSNLELNIKTLKDQINNTYKDNTEKNKEKKVNYRPMSSSFKNINSLLDSQKICISPKVTYKEFAKIKKSSNDLNKEQYIVNKSPKKENQTFTFNVVTNNINNFSNYNLEQNIISDVKQNKNNFHEQNLKNIHSSKHLIYEDKRIKENVMSYEQLDFVESNQGKNQNLVSTRILSNDENLIISEKVNESIIKNENNENKILQKNLMDNNKEFFDISSRKKSKLFFKIIQIFFKVLKWIRK